MSAKSKKRTKRHSNRQGGAVVEAALVLPVLVILTLGVIDISQYICLSQVVNNASRECARVASRAETSSSTDVATAAKLYFADLYPNLTDDIIGSSISLTISDANGTTVTDLSAVESGSQMEVFLAFDFQQIRWLKGVDYWTGSADQSTTVFRKE